VERVLFAHRVLPTLRPDVAQDPGPYSEWVQRQEQLRGQQAPRHPDAEVLHLVMVVADEPPPGTVRTLQALQAQTSTRWRLTVVLRASWQTAFTALLAVSGLHRTSQRVRVECVEDSSTPDQMLRLGLDANTGANLSLLFPGDVWAPDAVAQLGGSLSARAVVYADEDSVGPGDEHVEPRLKPAFSPELLLASAYIGRPLAIGGGIVLQPSTSTAGLADLEHDLALRACEAADEVLHLPHVLCHRLLDTPGAPEPQSHDVAHVLAALQRRGETADVTPGAGTGTYRIRRHSTQKPTISIIIPFRDQPQFMRTCIESIDATRGDTRIDFVLIDNGSAQPETVTLVERLAQRDDVQVLNDARPFNWSELNNAGAQVSSGEVLVFLNNDIEAHGAGWVDVLSTQAMRPEVGAVGARLLYPDRRLQHCGVVIGVGGAADHILAGLDVDEPGYLHMATSTRECAAVTGACLATRRDVFEKLEGFDESLGVDLNDIDYCLRAQRAGLKVMYEANAELLHHESPSRGFAGGARDIKKFIDRWQATILAGDPYLNPNLTRIDSSCALRRSDEGEWWQQWYASFAQN
jgi:GT2 family glycosyltransferase